MNDWDDEHRSAVRAMSEMERAPYDDPQTYADLMDADGVRYGHR